MREADGFADIRKKKNSMKKILVVEDELNLQKNIQKLLTRHGYQAIAVSDLTEAMHYVLNDKGIDLFLLDVWLDGEDGFELCRRIRRHSLSPILFLTACNDEASVVKGLTIGGDDYIAKPFRAAELISRIQANLRRQDFANAANILYAADIKLDLEQCIAYKSEKELHLGTTEYQLLFILMQNAGRIMSRDRLMERLWDASGKSAEDNTLSVNMSRLRKKTGADYIETIRGFGYRFTKPVARHLE